MASDNRTGDRARADALDRRFQRRRRACRGVETASGRERRLLAEARAVTEPEDYAGDGEIIEH